MKQDNSKRNFDFTSVPRNLIYRDRRHLDDFGVESPLSLNHYIQEKLYDAFAHFEEYENFATEQFNYAYYICTMAIAEKHPERRFGSYVKIVSTHYHYNNMLSGTILAMVLLQIRMHIWDITPGMKRFAESIDKELRNGQYGNLYMDFYQGITKDVNRIPQERFECAPLKDFMPRKIDRKILMDVCRDWDWRKEFGSDEEKFSELILAIGKSEDERNIISQFLHEQTPQTDADDKIENDAGNNARLMIRQKDEEILKLKEDLEVYQREPISNDPHDKVRLEIFCKLLEAAGVNFQVYGRKAEAARFAHHMTGIPISTCKNYMTNRDLNTTEHAEEVLKTNSSIKKLGIEWQL